MWSDNDIDNAFRRLDPTEPEPTPFPLDAWLKLEAGLDQAVIDRAVRRRLWQFFAAEVAIVALIGLGWWLWPASGVVPARSAQPNAAAALRPAAQPTAARQPQLPAASAAAAPIPTQASLAARPAASQQTMAAPAISLVPAAAAAAPTGANRNALHLPLALALVPGRRTVAPVRAHSNEAMLAAGRSAPAIPKPNHPGRADDASRETGPRQADALPQAGAVVLVPVGPGRAPVAQREPASRPALPDNAVGASMAASEADVSGAVVADAAPPRSAGLRPAEAALPLLPAPENAGAVGADYLQPATAAIVVLARPTRAALPATLPPTDAAPLPLPATAPSPRFYAGLVAAPDVSTVRFADVQAPRLSVGLTLEYRLGQRWRVATGLQRVHKAYYARRQDYDWSHYPRAQTRDFGWVEGQCTVLDVPLNLRYDAVVQGRGRWFGTAGLSSLFMQRENYSYDYQENGTSKNWELPGLVNANRHFFSVLNLSAGYEYELGPHWRLQAEPYAKVPLAGVGAGKVKLLSGGVYFGLKYGF